MRETKRVCDRVNKESLRQILRMYDVGDKLLNGIKSMYVNSLPCIREKYSECEWFRIDRGVRRLYPEPLAFKYVYGWRGWE